jgi:hypothetical protein
VFRRFAVASLVWIAFCAALFFALRGLEDPSRPKGRILSLEAGRRAIAILHDRDRVRYRDFEAVHVARARAGEGGREDRWVVLCDRVPHTGLREAVVVELGMDDGRLLALRPPNPPAHRADRR